VRIPISRAHLPVRYRRHVAVMFARALPAQQRTYREPFSMRLPICTTDCLAVVFGVAHAVPRLCFDANRAALWFTYRTVRGRFAKHCVMPVA